MIPSAVVNITINGRQIHARAGQTVLEAAAEAGIDIPALCHHPALPPAGACRVCLVEIQDQRTLQPACTFPIFDGMVVQTETERVVAARVFALQMIFSERSHYCMFCPASGSDNNTDCELQKLAYRYGLTCWEHVPAYQKNWPVDASGKYFVMDHSRCILCRRCVRACAEISANHTLGVHQRGARTMIGADDDQPLGQSTCVSCGTCLQVCPTGALMDRRSSFLGHETDVQRIKTTCLGCSVGCAIECLTRDNILLRIEGDWTGHNGGLLCSAGRFDAVDAKPPRIRVPLVRTDGELRPASWGEALERTAHCLRETRNVAGLISPRTINEGLVAFSCFFNEVLNSDEVALLHGEVPPEVGEPASIADINDADCLVVVGGDLLKNQKVVGYLTKRAFDRGAQLVIVNDARTDLDAYAQQRMKLDAIAHTGASPFERLRYTYHLRLEGISKLKSAVDSAQHPVVMYGTNLSIAVYAALRGLPRKARFLPLIEGANAAGAARLGLTARAVQGDALFVLAGDELPNGKPLPEAEFTVIQSAYRTDWTDAADVVLPARVWSEKQGSLVNLEGRELPVVPLTEAPPDIHPDWVTLATLSSLMGHAVLFGSMADVQRSL
ncbi:MAG TPA: 2Fe-2S iron-sulfur cluster-binding protein [Candidatus Anammoximicrobium sp.]|nr:2Fe-2S iron-sulfur cluster-binding protein [Candidatus Anammoximicrobium sp.]